MTTAHTGGAARLSPADVLERTDAEGAFVLLSDIAARLNRSCKGGARKVLGIE